MSTEVNDNPAYYGQQGAPMVDAAQDNGYADQQGQPVHAQPAYGTVDSILTAADITEEDMWIPEWNCVIRVRALTKAQQHAIRTEASRGQKNGEPNAERVEMLMFLTGVIQPEFGREHYGQLLNKNTGVIDRVIQKIAAMSGASQEAIQAAIAQFPEGR